MASSGTRDGGCDPETLCGKTNAGEGIHGIVGAEVHAVGCGSGTWTFPTSKA